MRRRILELDPTILILMGLPCGVRGNAVADRGRQEGDHEDGGRDEQRGHPDPVVLVLL